MSYSAIARSQCDMWRSTIHFLGWLWLADLPHYLAARNMSFQSSCRGPAGSSHIVWVCQSFFYMLIIMMAIGFRGSTPLPRKLKWLAFSPRGVGALPVHAITIARKLMVSRRMISSWWLIGTCLGVRYFHIFFCLMRSHTLNYFDKYSGGVMEFGAKFIARKPNFLTEYWSFQYRPDFRVCFLISYLLFSDTLVEHISNLRHYS